MINVRIEWHSHFGRFNPKRVPPLGPAFVLVDRCGIRSGCSRHPDRKRKKHGECHSKEPKNNSSGFWISHRILTSPLPFLLFCPSWDHRRSTNTPRTFAQTIMYRHTPPNFCGKFGKCHSRNSAVTLFTEGTTRDSGLAVGPA